MLTTIIDTFSRFSLHQSAIVVFSLFLLLFGILIHIQDRTKRRGKFFLLFMGILLWWGIALAFSGAAPHIVHTMLTILYLGAGVAPLIAFLFLDVPPTKESSIPFWHYFAVFIPPILMVLAVLSPDFIIKEKIANDTIRDGFFFGKGYLLYFFYQAIFFGAAAWSLLKKYRSSEGIFKAQARDMLVIFAIAATIFVSLAFFYPRLLNIYDLFFFGYISVALGALGVGFLLIKYDFWSLEIIAVEFLTLITIFILLIRFFLSDSFSGVAINTALTITIVIASLYLIENIRREIKSRDGVARILYDIDETKKRLSVLDKKKTEFLAIASHHLRDPLTAIKGYSSMIIDGSFGETPPLVLDAVIKIFESSKRLITTISDFMDISNIESGDVRYSFTEVDMEKLVVDVTNETRLSAKRAGSSFDVSIDRSYEDYSIIADTKRIRQVITSLVDNAIKYTPQGNITVLLSKTPDESKVVLKVSDTGIGMNESTLEKIFKKFSRADGVSKIYTEGLGLGLYVAKEIVNAHKGRIWATSEGEGIGSTFYMELNAKKRS